MLKKIFYSTCKIRHCLAVLFCFFLYLRSNSQVCTGCTTVISSNTSANITVGPSDFVCIAPGVSATGNITLNGGKLCNEGTVSNLTLIQGYFYNHGEFSKPTGNLNITNAKNLWIECYGTSNFNLTNAMNIDALTNADSVMINVYKGAKFSIGKSLSMSKGYLKIRNALDKSGEFLPIQCYFNIGGQLNVSNAALRILNNDYGIFNVTNAINLEGKYNKTILNYGLFSCNNSFNISGNGQNQYNVQIENNGTFNITRHLNSAYNNGTVTINNNEYPVKPEPSFSIGRSLTISKANNTFNNKVVLTVEQDVFLENGSLTNTRSVYVNRDVEVKNGTINNDNEIHVMRDFLISNINGTINQNGLINVTRDFNNVGTFNMGKSSYLNTNNYYNLNQGTINGPATIANDDEYAVIYIIGQSQNTGYINGYILVYDETLIGTTNNNGYGFDQVTNASRISSNTLFAARSVGPSLPPAVNCAALQLIFNVAATGSPLTICAGGSSNLTSQFRKKVGASFVNFTIPTTSYNWSPASSLSCSNCQNPIASPSSTTQYTVTANFASCTFTNVVTITVSNLSANAGLDRSILPSTSTMIGGLPAPLGGLVATASGGTGIYTSYSWNPSTSISSNSIANPTSSPLTTITYTVTITDSQGCTASDDVTIKIQNYEYVKLLKKLDGSYYESNNNKVYFTTDGQYSLMNLNYSVFNHKRVIQTGLTITSSTLKNGDNRYELNISTLPTGYYILEVTNQKNETLFLRIKK